MKDSLEFQDNPSWTPEQRKAALEHWNKAYEYSLLTPEERTARLREQELRNAADLTEKITKQHEAELKVEEARTRREQIRKGLSPSVANGPRTLVGRSLGSVQPRSIQWLWTGWVPKGYITLLAGETGAGKTTVLADIAARITTGSPWPGEFHAQPGENATRPHPVRPASRVLWLGSEDGIEEMTVPRLMACGANLNNVIEIQGVTQEGQRNTFSMQDDLGAVAEWLVFAETEGHPFAMLVIDPVTSYLPGQKLRRVDLNDAGQLRSVLEPWLILAQKHRIAVVCVTHFAKDTARAMLHRVLGSAAFAQTCRSLIAVIEPPATDDYEPDQFERAMIQVKVNLPEHPGGAWRFCTEKVEVGTDPDYQTPIYATRPAWEQLDHALTPKTAVGPARGPQSQYGLPFAVWLQAFFAERSDREWLRVDLVKMIAITEKVATENWWSKNSNTYLEKRNDGGCWFCRPKGTTPKETP
ncbi:AAA family ATPase [Silicimonas algicola]|nr:AAA family ATPase [Silicimonas algicola]